MSYVDPKEPYPVDELVNTLIYGFRSSDNTIVKIADIFGGEVNEIQFRFSEKKLRVSNAWTRLTFLSWTTTFVYVPISTTKMRFFCSSVVNLLSVTISL